MTVAPLGRLSWFTKGPVIRASVAKHKMLMVAAKTKMLRDESDENKKTP
jgi:hypothetical protein